MNKTKKSAKILCAVLSVLMVLTALPMAVFHTTAETEDKAAFSSTGSWEHEINSEYDDGRGTNYVSLKLSATDFKFIQTKADEVLTATSTFSALKNNGVNWAKLDDMVFTDDAKITPTVSWVANLLRNSKTPSTPVGAELPGTLGSGYSDQQSNNTYYWYLNYSFTSPGAGEYKTTLDIEYTSTSNATTGTKTAHSTADDNESITLTFSIIDKSEIIPLYERAKTLLSYDSSLTELAELVKSIEESGLASSKSWNSQEDIDEAAKQLGELIDAAGKSTLGALITKAESINRDYYTDESASNLNTALEEAKSVYENENATDEEIKNAIDKLADAIDNLVVDATAGNPPVEETSYWQHQLDNTDTAGRGEHYITMQLAPVEYKFVQTEKDEQFRFTSLFAAYKNDGTNWAQIVSLTYNNSENFEPVIAYNARTDLGKNTPDSPVGAELPGKLGSGFEAMKKNNACYWDINFTFTSKGAGTYTSNLDIEYKTGGSSLASKKVYSTNDDVLYTSSDVANPINYTITVTDETALIDLVNKAKDLVNENPNLTDISDLISQIEADHKTDGSVWYEQSVIDATYKELSDKIIEDLKNQLSDAIDNAESVSKDGMTPDSITELENSVNDGKDILNKSDATIDEIKNATDSIMDAITDLTPDKSDLKDAVDNANKLDKDSYTEETAKELEDKINDAQKVLDDPNATVEDIKNAADNLDNAVKELELIKITVKDDSSIIVDRGTDYTYMVGLTVGGNSVDEIKADLENDEIQIIVLRNDTVLTGEDKVGTGCIVKCVSKNDPSIVYEVATVILYGDVNGDGLVDSTDADLLMNNAFFGSSSIEKDTVFFIAADLEKDGVLDMFDYFYQDAVITGERVFDQSVTLYK